MHEFGVSLRLGMLVCMVSRVKQTNLESFGLWLENWIWKVKNRR